MEDFGQCPRALHFCPKCPRRRHHERQEGVILELDQLPNHYQEWCRLVKCPMCTTTWYVCVECAYVRKHIHNESILNRHYKTAHAPNTQKRKYEFSDHQKNKRSKCTAKPNNLDESEIDGAYSDSEKDGQDSCNVPESTFENNSNAYNDDENNKDGTQDNSLEHPPRSRQLPGDVELCTHNDPNQLLKTDKTCPNSLLKIDKNSSNDDQSSPNGLPTHPD